MAPLCAQFLDFAAVPALSALSSRVLGRRQRDAARRKPSTTGRHQLLHEMVTPVLSWMLAAWVRLQPWIHQSQAEWPLLLGKKVPIFSSQHLQELFRLLSRAVLPLRGPLSADAPTCRLSVRPWGRGGVFCTREMQVGCENCSGRLQGLGARCRCAVRFVGSCQLVWHFVAVL